MPTRQYIGARYVPKFFDGPNGSNNWVPGIAYEALTIVTYLNNSYTSKIPVPATQTTPNLDTEHWILTGAYNAQVEQYRQEMLALKNQLEGEMAGVSGQITQLDEKIQAELEKTNLVEHSNILTVGKTGARFTTINAAIDYAKTYCTIYNRVLIAIYTGDYDEEIILVPNPGIDLIGIGPVTIYHASDYPNSPLYTTGNGYFKNLRFSSFEPTTTGKDTYGVHIEGQSGPEVASYIRFENCIFEAYSNVAAFGLGLGPNYEVRCTECVFACKQGHAIYFHNFPREASNQTFRLFNCKTFPGSEGKDIAIDDAAMIQGQSKTISPFELQIEGGFYQDHNVQLRTSLSDYFYYISEGQSNLTATNCYCRALPGADFHTRTKAFTQDMYFSGPYFALQKPDEWIRNYSVSAINPADGSAVSVEILEVTSLAINMKATGWEGGPLRVTITSTIGVQ